MDNFTRCPIVVGSVQSLRGPLFGISMRTPEDATMGRTMVPDGSNYHSYYNRLDDSASHIHYTIKVKSRIIWSRLPNPAIKVDHSPTKV